mmetsp:Transcript_3537/g.8295  ORF Transcript_3537/g.8295 Transcript_3537/m.8295 type:complete len:206 (+) Transcript_3537:75-692(+)
MAPPASRSDAASLVHLVPDVGDVHLERSLVRLCDGVLLHEDVCMLPVNHVQCERHGSEQDEQRQRHNPFPTQLLENHTTDREGEDRNAPEETLRRHVPHRSYIYVEVVRLGDLETHWPSSHEPEDLVVLLRNDQHAKEVEEEDRDHPNEARILDPVVLVVVLYSEQAAAGHRPHKDGSHHDAGKGAKPSSQDVVQEYPGIVCDFH